MISKRKEDMIKTIPGLDNVRKNTMITDATANMKAAFSKLGKAGLIHLHILCVDHLINTVLSRSI